VLGVENPIGRDAEEFDRRWNELAERLASEMGGAAPDPPPAADSVDDGAPPPGAEGGAERAASDAIVHGDEDAAGGGDEAWEALAAGRDPFAGAVPPGPRDWAEPEEEEHFVPPTPPPVTAGEPLLVLAWTATVAGLLGIAAIVVLRLDVPWFWPRALALLAAAGIATLIWRMPHKRADPDDTGAQV
jgi:hypothetical protein